MISISLIKKSFFLHNNGLKLIALFFCVFAIALRYYRLDYHSFWEDEMFTSLSANPDFTLTEFFINLRDEISNPPLHNLFMWGWYHVFPYNEFYGRLPSVIFGIATLPVIYQIAKSLFNKNVALYSVILAAVNYQLIDISRGSRYGVLLVLLTCLSYLFFIKLLKRPCMRNYTAYYVSCVFLLYTHYFGAFVVAAQGAYLIYLIMMRQMSFPHIRNLAICYFLIVLSILPLLGEILAGMSLNNFNGSAPDNIGFYLSFPLNILKWFYEGKPLTLIFLGFIIYACVITIRNRNRKHNNKNFDSLILLLLLPVNVFILAYAVMIITDSALYVQRYYIVNAVTLIVIPAYGISISTNWVKISFICLFLIIIGYFLLYSSYYNDNKIHRNWKDAAQLLAADDYPKVIPSAFQRKVTSYYFTRYGEHELYGIDDLKNICVSDSPCLFWLIGNNKVEKSLSKYNISENNSIIHRDLEFSLVWARLYEVNIK